MKLSKSVFAFPVGSTRALLIALFTLVITGCGEGNLKCIPCDKCVVYSSDIGNCTSSVDGFMWKEDTYNHSKTPCLPCGQAKTEEEKFVCFGGKVPESMK